MLARFHSLRVLVLAVVLATSGFSAQSFTVVVYNAENVHDADGVAVYEDYQSDHYTPRHLATKVENIAALLAKFRGGEGPDIVLLQEIEIDQTPDSTVDDVEAFLAEHRGAPVGGLLDTDRLPAALRGVPAEVWLLKALADVGITDYHVAAGSDAPMAPGADSGRAIKCVTLSKFPFRAVRQYPVESARNILEVELEIEGHPLFVFNNHWKSGAGDPELEKVRIQNATVLRERLDEILTADPTADIVIGGDFNAHYNQKPRYADMPRTSVNDVLRAQGSERALQAGEADLYNLWFELKPADRGSDIYRGEWGTLMHLVVSRGLYDWNGVQYQDNSFNLARVIGENATIAGAPVRWSSGGERGAGYSDHLPLYAHFRTVDADRADLGMPLDNPSDEQEAPAEVWKVNFAAVDLNQAVDVAGLPESTDLRDGSWTGRLFKVEGQSMGSGRDLRVRVGGQVYDIYAPQREVRDALSAQHIRHRRVEFYGELGTYKGNWQFVVQDINWVP